MDRVHQMPPSCSKSVSIATSNYYEEVRRSWCSPSDYIEGSRPHLVGVAYLFTVRLRRDDEQVRTHQDRDQHRHLALNMLVLGFGAI